MRRWVVLNRLVVLMLLLSACTGPRGLSLTKPYALEATPPPGTPVFMQGYQDGCESALSGMGNQFLKVFHQFKYDAMLANDKLYNRMWQAANNYCRLYLFVGDEQLVNEDFMDKNHPLFFWR